MASRHRKKTVVEDLAILEEVLIFMHESKWTIEDFMYTLFRVKDNDGEDIKRSQRHIVDGCRFRFRAMNIGPKKYAVLPPPVAIIFS